MGSGLSSAKGLSGINSRLRISAIGKAALSVRLWQIQDRGSGLLAASTQVGRKGWMLTSSA